MIGAIIGDIAGSAYEFSPIKTKEFELFAPHRGLPCRFTDDSVMTLAVAKAVMSSAPDWHDLAENAVKFMRQIGRRYPDCGYGGRFARWLASEGDGPYNSYGNGSAMRVSSVAYAAGSLAEALRMADCVTAVTHDHPEGLKGARAAAACVYLALHGSGKEEIRRYVEEHFYALPASLAQVRPGYRFEVSCQKSVPQAILAFLESENFEDAIRSAVSLGGDSDTQAAIAGSIAEACYGVPAALREKAVGFLSGELAQILVDFEAWRQTR